SGNAIGSQSSSCVKDSVLDDDWKSMADLRLKSLIIGANDFITAKSILVLLGQKVNTTSTNINDAMLPLVLLEGNLVCLITVEIFKALTSFIEVEIKAIVDGHDKTNTEASARSSLQLADAYGISNMSTTKNFEQLALMGILLPHSRTHIVPILTQKVFGKMKRGFSEFPTQTQVANETTFTSVDIDAGGAATTDISLDVGQGSSTIHKTPIRLNDAPLSGVNTPGSAEGSLSQTELMDFVLKLAKKVEGLETELKNTKQIYGKVYTKLVQRVKSLEDQLKTEKSKFTKRKFQIVIFEDEADLPVEDSSKLERRDVNTGSEGVNTAGDTANVMHQHVNILIPSSSLKDKDPGQREGKAIMEVDEIQKKFKKGEYKQISHDEEVAQKLHAEELAKDKARQEQEKYDLEKALELQKLLEEKEEHVYVFEESGRIQAESFQENELCVYIRLIFENIWDQNHAFVPKDSEIEKEVMKRPGFDLQQESIKKNEKIKASGFVQKQPAGEEKETKKDAESSKQVEEEIVAKARDDKDKRQKMQDDPEKLTLMEYVEVISDSEEIISVIPLAVKSPIVN
ncbi:hypothetical protein Tco_0115321, partial [Tanacetum coccineum]